MSDCIPCERTPLYSRGLHKRWEISILPATYRRGRVDDFALGDGAVHRRSPCNGQTSS